MLDVLPLLPTLALGAALLWAIHCASSTFLFPSAVSKLPGPPRRHFWSGNLEDVLNEEPGAATLRWHAQYGHAIRFVGFSGQERLSLMDPAALYHVLVKNPYSYHNAASKLLQDVLGPGLIVSEGDVHKRQRKLVNPAFSPAQIGRLDKIFESVARELTERIRAQVTSAAAPDSKTPSCELNMPPLFTRATLDILGLAAFAHDFETLKGREDELSQALEHGLTKTAGHRLTKGFTVANVLIAWFPFLRHIPAPAVKAMRVSLDATLRESRRLLGELRSVSEAGGVNDGKDVLSLLLRSSERERADGLTDDEIVAQMATFVVAGHETTATVLGWAVHELVENPEAQRRLREELELAAGQDLAELPFLDAVVKETLRLHPPVPALIRRAVADDVIPFSEPVTLSDGTTTVALPIARGQFVYVPLASLQRAPELWGADAGAYRPARFLEADDGGLGRKEKTKYALWGDLPVFGGGPRSCVGYRFALAELKHILSALVLDLQFAKCAAPTKIVGRVSPIIARPFVESREDEGSTLPVRVTLIDRV